MSVKNYDCEACGENGVYDEYILACNNCWNRICYRCSTVKSKDAPFMGEDISDEDGCLESRYCPFCSGEKVTDGQRVSYLLELSGKTVEEVDSEIIKQREK
jgi:hypothetical protein